VEFYIFDDDLCMITGLSLIRYAFYSL